jgi:predicted nucleic acid-binding protein
VPFVLDASVALSWHFPDERNAGSDLILDAFRRDYALVPALWWFEIRNILILGERRGRSTQVETVEFLDRLARLRISFAPQPTDTNIFALARKHGLTFYDAAYLELAQRENVLLATLDAQLASAARRERVVLMI